MAFGWKQIGKPTPASATWVFRTVLYTAAAVNIICMVISEIPQSVKDIIGRYSIEAVTLVHMFSKLFGVPIPDDTQIPAKDVATLKTDTPKLK